MKLSVLVFLICAAVRPAGAQSGWPPDLSAAALAAAPAPALGVPVRATPRDGVNYSAAEEILIKEFDMPGVSLDIPEAQVGAQLQGSPCAVPFEQALRSALHSFLTDYSDQTGPLAAVLSGMGVAKPTKSDIKKAGQKLAQLMNMPGASLYLVREGGPLQAARGEKVSGNWIFSLRLDNYSRYYWAVTDRSGRNETYNYGAD